ncbi:hypothetical protein CDD81_6713 [Ophiocordyceps australis]|uniref:Uncharacterized protein n=1 Tax=Ophiocordyceps australis TaxID=1399860 RepID=A0A2C5XZQ4_9HYPO|nr:hypothetical protein CDD81_6713 [Ophiocordyceps australis]
MTIRTACSSSLTAFHKACQGLYNGECSAAIVAGTSLILSPTITLEMTEQGVLSPTGSCKTFDAAADGFVRGEAINAVLIKRLDDAVRNKDPIRAVIRSIALNCDGKTAGFTLPNSESQEVVIRKAYEMASLDPSQTRFVECHGTGTAIGDPLEATAVANVFQEHGTYIGSVKPNCGHSEGAAGITSLIKAVLALEHKVIPPNIHFKNPNPKIPFKNGKIRVPVDVTPWPKDALARVSISSFGVGGANAHAVMDSASLFGGTQGLGNRHEQSFPWPRLLPISANNADSLRQRAQDVIGYMKQNPGSVDGVGYTLGIRRQHLPYRTFCIAHQDGSISEIQGVQKRREAPQVVFVFTGQGAQWAGMARDLILTWPSFQDSIRKLDDVLQRLEKAPSWTIQETLCDENCAVMIEKAEYAQPLSTAIQIALVDLMTQCGVKPRAVIGHSSGEIAAAYAAGAITAAEAILISYFRGQAMRIQSQKGGMAVVGLGRDAVAGLLVNGVVVACENSPENVTLSGNRDALLKTLEKVRTEVPGIFVRELRVDMAYHSAYMREISGATAHVPFYSTVSGQLETVFGASYWKANLEMPVLFSSAMRTLMSDLHKETLFVEVGSHFTLSSPLRQNFAAYSSISHPYIPTLKRNSASATAVVDTLGQLYMHGYLPNYPWDHRSEFWRESRISLAWRQMKHPYHELLGFICLEASDLEPTWRNVLRLGAIPWLIDHKVLDDVVFPCTGYIALMGEAIRQITMSDSYTLRDLIIKSPIVLQDSKDVELVTSMKPVRLTDSQNSSWFDFSISSFNGTSWVQNCVAQGKAAEKPVTQARLRQFGLNYGPCFQGMSEMRADIQTAAATASLNNEENDWEESGGASLDAHAMTRSVGNGAISGNVVAIAEGGIAAIEILDAKMSPFEKGQDAQAANSGTAYLKWRPDISFVDPGTLIRPLLDTIAALDPVTGYLANYTSWLRQEKQLMMIGETSIPEAQQWATLDAESRQHILAQVVKQVYESSSREIASVFDLVRKLFDASVARDMFEGKIHPLQIMLENDGLAQLYNICSEAVDYRGFLSLNGYARPYMKVLEIGGGTGAVTEKLLTGLQTSKGVLTFAQYTFTDISSGFFATAQKRFQDFKGLEYRVLDISRDPEEQGFHLGSYDLIVASNVFHATPCLHETLSNARCLLRPGGHLLMQELVQPSKFSFSRFIMGFLPGWWLELGEAGFSVSEAVTLDDEMPYQMNGIWIATAVDRCEMQGIEVEWRSIRDAHLVPYQDADTYISTVDLDGPYFHDVSPTDYKAFMDYLSTLGTGTGILWLTRPCQVECTDPRYGLVIGLARTIRTELSLDFATVELGNLDSATADAVFSVWNKFYNRSLYVTENFDYESEYVIDHDGLIYIGRYDWFSIADELETVPSSHVPLRLTAKQPRLIDSLSWVQHELEEVGADQVEVEIHCTGLNFRDILLCMNIIKCRENEFFGFEAAGVVSRVGSDIQHVNIGDRVMTMSWNCFATRKVVLGELVVPIPDDLSFEDAATMPISILIHSACGGVGLAAIQICKMLGATIYATVGSEEKAQFLMENFGLCRENIFDSRSTVFLQDTLRATKGHGVDIVLNSLSGDLLHASWKCVAKYGKMIEIGKRDIFGRAKLAMEPFQDNRTFHAIDLSGMGVDRPKEIQRLMEECLEYYQQGHIKPIRPINVYSAQTVVDAFRYMQSGRHIGKIIVTLPQDDQEQMPAHKMRPNLSLAGDCSYLLVGGMGGLGKALAMWMVECGARSLVFFSRSAGTSSEDQAFMAELECEGCCVVAVNGDVGDLAHVRRAVSAAPKRIAGVLQLSMVLRDLPLLETGHDDWTYVQTPKVKGTWNIHEALETADLDFFILFGSLAGVYGNPGQASYAAANTFLTSFAQYRQSRNLPCSVVDVGFMEGIGFVSRNPVIKSQAIAAGGFFCQEQDLVDATELSIRSCLDFNKTPQLSNSNGYCNRGQVVMGLKSSKLLSDPASHVVWKRSLRMSHYSQIGMSNNVIKSYDADFLDLIKSIAADPRILDGATTREAIVQGIGRILCRFTLHPQENLDGATTLSSMGVDSLVGIEIRNWWQRTLGVNISILHIMNAATVQGLGKVAIDSLREKYSMKLESKSGGEA